MAKKPIFESKSVKTAPTKTGGLDFKALIDHAGGVDAIIRDNGIKGRDARQLRKAAETVSSSGNTFLLKDKGFDVFQGKDALTSSGRNTGNKKGFNAGDLVGLGNTTSKLAGVLSNYKESYLDSQKKKAPKEKVIDVASGPKFKEEVATTPSKTSSVGASKKMSARDLILQKQKESGLSSKLDAFSDKYNKRGDFTPGGGSFKGSGTSGSFDEEKKKSTTPILTTRDVVGDLADVDNAEYWAKMAAIWNPSQFWSQAARDKAIKYAQEDKPDPNKLMGGFPDAGLLGALFVPGGQGIVKKAVQKGTKITAQKLLTAGKGAPKQLTKGLGEYAPKANPNVSFKGTDQSSSAIKKAINALDDEASAIFKNPNVVYKGTSTKSKAIKEASKRMSEGFEKGGKLPKYGPGGNLPFTKKPGGLTEAQLLELSGTANKYNMASFVNKSGYKSPEVKIGATGPSGSVSIPKDPKYSDPNFGLGKNKSSEKGNTPNAGDIGADVAKYALPYVSGAIRDRQLSKNTPTVKYSPQDLMVGTVQDLPRPNFKLRSREPIGTDVLTQQLGQKFGDAFQRSQEADFNTKNALSKLQQKDQVIGRINQQRGTNNQGQFRADMINAQIKGGVAQQKYGAGMQRDIGAFQNLMGQTSDNAYINADNATRAWEAEVKDKNTSDARRKELYLQGIPRKGKKGMKFKTRYGK